jgi:hypothetical protein
MSAWVPEHDKRQSKASAKVTDATNGSKPGLKSHQAARDLAEAEASRKKPPTSTCPATTSKSTAARRKPPASILEDSDDDSHAPPKGFQVLLSHFFNNCL